MKYLFWDVDGTLLLTGGAGTNAMADAIKEHFNLPDFEFNKSLAGRTDSEIIKAAVLQIKGNFKLSDAASLLIKYHQKLPQYLNKYQGSVLYNVENTLQFFQNNPEFENCLLTGNTRTGAKLKLEHYKLYKYFNFNKSVFGETSENRTELAKVARQRIYVENPQIASDDFIFIGDTPNDVLCAQAIDAKCLIILSGSHYEEADFQDFSNCKVLKTLPDNPSELVKIIEEWK